MSGGEEWVRLVCGYVLQQHPTGWMEHRGACLGFPKATPTTAREDGLGVTVKDNNNNNKII